MSYWAEFGLRLFTTLKLRHVLLSALVLRLICVFYFADLKNENYWEYGTIANNLLVGNGYSYHFIDNNNYLLPETYPSAYVPPGYVFFILPFLLIKKLIMRNIMLFSLQSIISVLGIYFSYKSIHKLTDKSVAISTALLIGFTPELIYTSCTVGPTTIFYFLLSLWFYLRLELARNATYQWYAGTVAGVACLFRSELLLFFFLIAIYDCFKARSVFYVLKTTIPIFICLTPWLVRNYSVFGKVVITNNVGLNLCRGNNPVEAGIWYNGVDSAVYIQLKEQSVATFELTYNQICTDYALKFIKKNPTRTLQNIAIKFSKHWLFDWNDPRCHQLLYIVPWLFTLVFASYGIMSNWNIDKYSDYYLFQLSYCLIIMIFFAQLRYQTLIKYQLMPFAALGIIKLLTKYANREAQTI